MLQVKRAERIRKEVEMSFEEAKLSKLPAYLDDAVRALFDRTSHTRAGICAKLECVLYFQNCSKEKCCVRERRYLHAHPKSL